MERVRSEARGREERCASGGNVEKKDGISCDRKSWIVFSVCRYVSVHC